MRTLFISGHFPYDLRTNVHGVYKRMGTFIDVLKDLGTLDMLFFIDKNVRYSEKEMEQLKIELSRYWNADINLFLCEKSEFSDSTKLNKLLSFGQGIFSFFKQKGRIEYSGRKQVQAVEELIERKPDIIFAHRLSAMCPLLLTQKALAPVIFDMDDIEHLFLKRYIQNRDNIRSNLLRLLLQSLTRGEYNAVKLASKTFVCSKQDRDYLNKEYNLPGVTEIPNSIAIPKLEPLTSEPNLLFLASDYGPNIQAAELLVNEIWPIIKNELSEVRLIIAGIDGEKFSFSADSVPGLELPGFVDDLDTLYRRIRATVVPMLVGGGTRLKIIEAAMYGKPTVSTTLGAEGIDLMNSTEIIIQDTPESLAQACIKLLNDKKLSENIGLAARKTAIELYDRDKVKRNIKKHILSVLQ